MIAAIEWGKLGELIWVAALAAATVAVIYALAILGAARAEAAHRRGAHASSIAFGLLSVVALAVFLGTVAYGVSIIVAK